MSLRHMLCALLVVASSSTAVLAANDGVPNNGAPSAPTTAPSGSPAGPQAGVPLGIQNQPPSQGAPACRQAKGKSRPQLSADERARRKAIRAERVAQGVAPAAKPRAPKLPLC